MRIERAAYGNRWRGVAPSAKALFALACMAAVLTARAPASLAVLAAVPMLATLLLARVPARLYLAVLLPPLAFLAFSLPALLVTVDGTGPHWNPAALPTVTITALRALAMLAALLALTLTTPLPQLLALLRGWRVPAALLDQMALCYRMLFVLRQAWDDGLAAQQARLGYHDRRATWRSVGLLTGRLAAQVWQRAQALEQAAQARGYDGSLRFIAIEYAHARRQNAVALLAGALLVAGVVAGERL